MSLPRPYNAFLGINISTFADGREPLCMIEPGPRARSANGGIHSGAMAALLEAAGGALLEQRDPTYEVRPISITVDYLYPAAFTQTYARAEIVQMGRQIAHVDATAWQDDEDRPVAMARLVIALQ